MTRRRLIVTFAVGIGVISAPWAQAGDDCWTADGPQVCTVYRIAESGTPGSRPPAYGEGRVAREFRYGLHVGPGAGIPLGRERCLRVRSWRRGSLLAREESHLLWRLGPIVQELGWGRTWGLMAWFAGMVPTVLLVEPKRAGGLLVGNDSPAGVMYSQDSGNSWGPANAGLRSGNVLDRQWDATGDTLFASTRDGVYTRAWLGGAGTGSWRDISQNLAGQAVVAVLPPLAGEKEMVLGGLAGVYVGDGMSAWREIFSPASRGGRLWLRALARGTPPAKSLYVGTTVGLYFSPDGGRSWEERNFGLGNTAVLSILPLDSARLLLGTCDGLYATYDGGSVASRCYLLSAIPPPRHPECGQPQITEVFTTATTVETPGSMRKPTTVCSRFGGFQSLLHSLRQCTRRWSAAQAHRVTTRMLLSLAWMVATAGVQWARHWRASFPSR
jgi:hypothetical protein